MRTLLLLGAFVSCALAAPPVQYRVNGPFIATCPKLSAWFVGNSNLTTANVNVGQVSNSYLYDQRACANPYFGLGNSTCTTGGSGSLASWTTTSPPVASALTSYSATGGVSFASPTQLRTPPIDIPGDTPGVTVAAWVNIASLSPTAGPQPLLQLSGAPGSAGPFLFLMLASQYGFCVNHYATMPTTTVTGGGNMCNTMATSFAMPLPILTLQPTPGAYSPNTNAYSGTWTHITWTASASNVYSLYINGMLVAQGVGGATAGLQPFAAYYSPGGTMQAALTSVGGHTGTLGDLQVYTQAGTFMGGQEVFGLISGSCKPFPPLAGKDHRYVSMRAGPSPVTMTPPTVWMNDTGLADTGTSGVQRLQPIDGKMAQGGYGMGVSLGPGNWLDVSPSLPMEWGATTFPGMTLEANVYRTLSWTSQTDYNLLHLTLGPLTGLSSTGSTPANTFSVNVAKSCPYTSQQYAASDFVSTFGATVYMKHPVCGTVCFTTSALSIALSSGLTPPTGFFAPGSGVHKLVVTASADTPMAVSLDGVPYALHYIQSPQCTMAELRWPEYMPVTNVFVGNKGTSQYIAVESNFVSLILMDLSINHSPSSAGPDSSTLSGAAAATTPPPPWNSARITAAPTGTSFRLAGCAGASHRYGAASGPFPFAGGVVVDGVMGGNLNGVFTGFTASSNFRAQSNMAGSIMFPFICAALDFGSYVVGDEFSVAFMMGNGPGVTTCAISSWPANGPIFDFGGYSLYYNSYPAPTAQVPVYLMGPDGNIVSYMSPATAAEPNVPQAAYQYTVVTFSRTGTKIYLNGALWVSFPTVTLPQGGSDLESMRFWGNGNTASGNQVLLDLQFYDYALTTHDVHRMRWGLSCGRS